MFLNQQEERLFQGEDALALEWDFIEQNRVENTEQKSAKIVVMMNNQIKTIYLCKSTLTMDYSLMELRKNIIQEFQLPNKSYVMKIYSNRGTLITNDHTFKQILESSNLEVELHINLSERKHCIMCMKADCYHLSQKSHTAEKKRKMIEERGEINFLEPQMLSKSCGQQSHSHITLPKKRKVASCTQILNNSQDLLVPQNGTFIF